MTEVTTTKHNSDKTTPGESIEEFLATARKRFQLVCDSECVLRPKMTEDIRFYDGDDDAQWPTEVVTQRKLEKRPILTFNRLPESVHQVTNEFRQQKPAPSVKPVDDKADVKTAEAYQGLYRHIDRISNAGAARAYAAFYATLCGRGWYRITIDWADFDSFDQEIYIKRIKEQASVYMDPSAQEPDYSDAKWCFIVEDPLIEDYRAEYPESSLASALDLTSIGNTAPGWISGETIRVAEYFYIEYEFKWRAQLKDGSEIDLDKDGNAPQGVEIHRKARRRRPIVHWCKINAVEKLEEKVWPGSWIPVIPMLGEEIVNDGRTNLKGMVRNAIGAQQQYNFMRTAQIETIALAPRVPYVAAEGQLEGHEEAWRTANSKSHAVLQYKVKTVGGLLVPPPQRQNFEPAIQAMTLAVQVASEDIKTTLGIQDAARGARSNETSGVALVQKRHESDTANYHFMDGANTAGNHESRIILELIPKVYDRPGRVIRILGEDGSESRGIIAGGDQPTTLPQGVKGIYDLGAGKYDVATSFGATYSTKREQAAGALIEMTKVDPGLMLTAPDLVYKTLDIPGGDQIAERRKKALPPGLADDDAGDAQAQNAKLQQKIAQYEPMIDELTRHVEMMSDEIKTQKLKIDSDERIALAKLEVEREKLRATLATEAAKLQSKEGMFAMEQQLNVLGTQIEAMQAAGAGDLERDHEASQADADRDHEMQSAEADRAHQMQAADADRQHQAQEAELARQAQAQQTEVTLAAQERAAKAKAKATPAAKKKPAGAQK